MLWDVLMSIAALGLGIAGWNVGLINSWRGPIAMILATVVTHIFYVDFGTWMVQQLLIKPDYAALFAYLMMWLVVEIVGEIILGMVFTWTKKERPVILDRVGGVAFALIKWACICLFPVVAFVSPSKIPQPPPSAEAVINPFKLGLDDSHLIQVFKDADKGMPFLKVIIVSDKAPSFKPNLDRPPLKVE